TAVQCSVVQFSACVTKTALSPTKCPSLLGCLVIFGAKADGICVATGVAVGIGVADGDGAALGFGVGFGFGVGAAVAFGFGVTVGFGFGVTVGSGAAVDFGFGVTEGCGLVVEADDSGVGVAVDGCFLRLQAESVRIVSSASSIQLTLLHIRMFLLV
ncbi:MAG: hypothetical protein IIY89_00380, partial [Clostridia bacterium]|nr:hypothetical protein [Clostridia bacterium]